MTRSRSLLAVLALLAGLLVAVLPAAPAHAVTELTVGTAYNTASNDTGQCTGTLKRTHYLWHADTSNVLQHMAYGYVFKANGSGVNKDCTSVVKTNAQFSTSMNLSVSMDSNTSQSGTDSSFSGSGGTNGYVGPAYTTNAAPYSGQRKYTMSARRSSTTKPTLSQYGYIGQGTAYDGLGAVHGDCTGELIHDNYAVDGPNNATVTGRIHLFYNHGLQDDAREGNPGFCVSASGTEGSLWGDYTQNPEAWIDGTSTWGSAVAPYDYEAYPDAQATAPTMATPAAWLPVPANNTDPTFCIAWGGSVSGHYDGVRQTWGPVMSSPWTRQQYSTSTCTAERPWDTDEAFYPPTSDFENCTGLPQLGIPMKNAGGAYVAKLTLFYNPNLYTLDEIANDVVKAGEYCASVVPAPGFENAGDTNGQTVTMALIGDNDGLHTPSRTVSNSRVAVLSPADRYDVGEGLGQNCITISGWFKPSSTDPQLTATGDWCGEVGDVPDYDPDDEIADWTDYLGEADDCQQEFGEYMFFTTIRTGNCDPDTFPTFAEEPLFPGTQVGLSLYCRTTVDTDPNKVVTGEAQTNGSLAWDFGGYANGAFCPRLPLNPTSPMTNYVVIDYLLSGHNTITLLSI